VSASIIAVASLAAGVVVAILWARARGAGAQRERRQGEGPGHEHRRESAHRRGPRRPRREDWLGRAHRHDERRGALAIAYEDGLVLLGGTKRSSSGPYGREPVAEVEELSFPPTPRWARGGSLLGRYTPDFFTATGLADGRVLILAADACEIYDPSSRLSRSLPSPRIPRGSYTATLLADGTVLVAGGIRNVPPSDIVPYAEIAELFDPERIDAPWRDAGPLASPRTNHAAARLRDGRVLLCGGETHPSGRPESASAEIYDPSTGRFEPVASMLETRAGHIAVTISDGTVLAIGGYHRKDLTSSVTITSVERFHPERGTWTRLESLTRRRRDPVAAALADGRVLVAGGRSRPEDVGYAEIFDPEIEAWSELLPEEPMPEISSAVVVRDGRVALIGESEVDVFHPKRWAPAGASAPEEEMERVRPARRRRRG
jgi:hypothetical protein